MRRLLFYIIFVALPCHSTSFERLEVLKTRSAILTTILNSTVEELLKTLNEKKEKRKSLFVKKSELISFNEKLRAYVFQLKQPYRKQGNTFHYVSCRLQSIFLFNPGLRFFCENFPSIATEVLNSFPEPMKKDVIVNQNVKLPIFWNFFSQYPSYVERRNIKQLVLDLILHVYQVSLLTLAERVHLAFTLHKNHPSERSLYSLLQAANASCNLLTYQLELVRKCFRLGTSYLSKAVMKYINYSISYHQQLNCQILHSLPLVDEQKHFLLLNSTQSPLSPLPEQFHTEEIGEEEEALHLNYQQNTHLLTLSASTEMIKQVFKKKINAFYNKHIYHVMGYRFSYFLRFLEGHVLVLTFLSTLAGGEYEKEWNNLLQSHNPFSLAHSHYLNTGMTEAKLEKWMSVEEIKKVREAGDGRMSIDRLPHYKNDTLLQLPQFRHSLDKVFRFTTTITEYYQAIISGKFLRRQAKKTKDNFKEILSLVKLPYSNKGKDFILEKNTYNFFEHKNYECKSSSFSVYCYSELVFLLMKEFLVLMDHQVFESLLVKETKRIISDRYRYSYHRIMWNHLGIYSGKGAVLKAIQQKALIMTRNEQNRKALVHPLAVYSEETLKIVKPIQKRNYEKLQRFIEAIHYEYNSPKVAFASKATQAQTEKQNTIVKTFSFRESRDTIPRRLSKLHFGDSLIEDFFSEQNNEEPDNLSHSNTRNIGQANQGRFPSGEYSFGEGSNNASDISFAPSPHQRIQMHFPLNNYSELEEAYPYSASFNINSIFDGHSQSRYYEQMGNSNSLPINPSSQIFHSNQVSYPMEFVGENDSKPKAALSGNAGRSHYQPSLTFNNYIPSSSQDEKSSVLSDMEFSTNQAPLLLDFMNNLYEGNDYTAYSKDYGNEDQHQISQGVIAEEFDARKELSQQELEYEEDNEETRKNWESSSAVHKEGRKNVVAEIAKEAEKERVEKMKNRKPRYERESQEAADHDMYTKIHRNPLMTAPMNKDPPEEWTSEEKNNYRALIDHLHRRDSYANIVSMVQSQTSYYHVVAREMEFFNRINESVRIEDLILRLQWVEPSMQYPLSFPLVSQNGRDDSKWSQPLSIRSEIEAQLHYFKNLGTIFTERTSLLNEYAPFYSWDVTGKEELEVERPRRITELYLELEKLKQTEASSYVKSSFILKGSLTITNLAQVLSGYLYPVLNYLSLHQSYASF